MSVVLLVAPLLLLLAQAPAPTLDEAAVRELLLKGRITGIKTLSKGVTRPRRVTLTNGIVTQDAVFQSVNQAKPIERFDGGRVEIDFRDSYHFNIAAWEVARLVGLQAMVPPCVERIISLERGSLCWWVPWKWDEQMRVQQKLRPPDTVQWQRQWDTMRVFRELVDDTDRNQTNMLISESWHLWMVDFSRAFRKSPTPRKLEQLRRCPAGLLARLRSLDPDEVKRAVGRHLLPAELAAMFKRRDAIVAHFEQRIAEVGADNVLF
jgi:hypothetical protein